MYKEQGGGHGGCINQGANESTILRVVSSSMEGKDL